MNAKPMLLVILMAVPAFGQSVYKCPGPNGTIYQGKPCTDGAGTLMIDGGTDSRSRAERNPASGPPDPAEINRTIACAHIPKDWIGAAKEDFEACYGEPKNINRTVVSGLVREQWVYDEVKPCPTYVYFHNGVLHSFQD